MARPSLAPVLLLLLAACAGERGVEPAPAQEEPPVIRLEEVAAGLDDPVYLTAPAGDPRLFVVEQPGRIRVVRDGRLLETPFLDITDRVGSGGERGLLSVAFHPRYATNGLFYVDYTDRSGDTRVERYRVSSDPDRADRASASLVLAVEQPYSNHNGGLLLFGADGMLYVGLGDGGSGGDPHGYGQSLATLLGKILRIDVDAAAPYGVPAGNPFVGRAGARPEIWAYGLRNPWRFSFDREAGLLYLADVGQGRSEEIHVAPARDGGLNYGWKIIEGRHCFPSDPCDRTGLLLPAFEYGRDDGCSVTGGYVYRGSRMPALRGHYFYADYCRGWVRSFRYADGRVSDERDWELGDVGRVSSFGEDAAGELYVVSHAGRVLRIVPR